MKTGRKNKKKTYKIIKFLNENCVPEEIQTNLQQLRFYVRLSFLIYSLNNFRGGRKINSKRFEISMSLFKKKKIIFSYLIVKLKSLQ